MATPRLSNRMAQSSASSDYAAFQDAVGRAHKSGLRFLRWAFLLTIVPLVWFTLTGGGAVELEEASRAFSTRLGERLEADPKLKAKYYKVIPAAAQGSSEGLDKLMVTEESLTNAMTFLTTQPTLDALALVAEAFGDADVAKDLSEAESELADLNASERKIVLRVAAIQLILEYSGLLPDPFLPEDTWAHWGLGALAALLFLLYFCFAYPRGNARPQSLLGVGVFTGTLGIVLLFALQIISRFATGIRLRGRGIIMLIWLILVVIGFSYAAADDPENGFWISFFGFTIGVGMCEELCKALPVAYHFKRDGSLGWAGACLWGLASGAGFGVSEGIMYSSRYYNGSSSLGMYVVRFVSCVAMHAAWSGSSAILLYRRRDHVRAAGSFWEMTGAVMPTVLLMMVLHGLYDTLLKKDMAPWALLAGAVSFAYFIFLQEREARSERMEGLRLLRASQTRTSRI